MTNEKDEATFFGLSVNELRKIKDAILQLKQGEALERSSWPKDLLESFGLGYFGPETGFGLSAICAYEDVLNELASTPDDHSMYEFAKRFAVASGSRSAKRLELTLDTIGKLGGSIPMPTREYPQPEHLTAKEPG